MENLRSTVIMKTDLAGFTDQVTKSSHRDLSELLGKHDKIISEVVARHAGTIIKGEGDSFWITFTSVTTAALAALEIQRDLQHAQVGSSDEDRLAIRIAITVGDVLHQEGDIFGDSVNLTARIESITPPGEIYLSHAASLAVNNAEVSVDYVNEFDLKGFAQRERISRINQKDEIRLFENRVMLNSAVWGYNEFVEEKAIEDVEKLIIENEALAKHMCNSHGGTLLQTVFVSHKIIFENVGSAIRGVQEWAQKWADFLKKNNWQNHLSIGMHLGDLKAFRSHVFGIGLDKAIYLQRRIHDLHPENDRNSVLVTAAIYREIEKTDLALKFREFNPFELESVGRETMKERNEWLLRNGFEEGEKAYELLLSNQ